MSALLVFALAYGTAGLLIAMMCAVGPYTYAPYWVRVRNASRITVVPLAIFGIVVAWATGTLT